MSNDPFNPDAWKAWAASMGGQQGPSLTLPQMLDTARHLFRLGYLGFDDASVIVPTELAHAGDRLHQVEQWASLLNGFSESAIALLTAEEMQVIVWHIEAGYIGLEDNGFPVAAPSAPNLPAVQVLTAYLWLALDGFYRQGMMQPQTEPQELAHYLAGLGAEIVKLYQG